jgi:hypothetical protein
MNQQPPSYRLTEAFGRVGCIGLLAEMEMSAEMSAATEGRG